MSEGRSLSLTLLTAAVGPTRRQVIEKKLVDFCHMFLWLPLGHFYFLMSAGDVWVKFCRFSTFMKCFTSFDLLAKFNAFWSVLGKKDKEKETKNLPWSTAAIIAAAQSRTERTNDHFTAALTHPFPSRSSTDRGGEAGGVCFFLSSNALHHAEAPLRWLLAKAPQGRRREWRSANDTPQRG